MKENKKVLIVDDDDNIVVCLKQILKENCEITSVSTVAAAKEILSKEKFDTILCDWMLPLETGSKLIEWFETYPDHDTTKFIVLTSMDENRIRKYTNGHLVISKGEIMKNKHLFC